MNASMKRALLGCAVFSALVGIGCIAPGDPVYGASFSEAPFEVFDPTAGIHPSRVVLEDPNNPFADANSGRDTRFDIEANDEDGVTAFYSWASWLAREPTGESQFYAAGNLQKIWEAGNAPQEDLPVVRDMAIAGYQTVLDDFPDAVTFDETGTIPFELLTPSYQGIVELGGRPTGGWVIVEDRDGIPRAVRQ